MEKVYTQIRGNYVFPDSTNLDLLKPNFCAVKKSGGKPCVIPLMALKGKQVENGGTGYSPIWGYGEEKSQPYFLINGEKREPNFCNLCKDRLNGITGNCFNSSVKRSGCSFDPTDEVGAFQISLEGWKKVQSIDVNKNSGFRRAYYESEVSFDPETIKKNQEVRIIARNLTEHQEKKIEKYCSRCIYQGTCYMNSNRIQEHCMVTEEETAQECIKEIRRHYGSVEEYLKLLAFSGGRLTYRPGKYREEREWRVSQPLSWKKFLIISPFRYFSEAKVSRKSIEKHVKPNTLPSKDRDKIAALAWYYLERYHYRRLWVSPKVGGIEVVHRTRGAYYFFRRQTFTSFSEINYFSQR